MRACGQRGFTLTELVIVLVLVGILAAFVVPRIDIEGFERQAFASELTNALRYAQKSAIASGCHVRATVDAADDSYALVYTGAGGSTCGGGSAALPHPTRGGPFTGGGEIDGGGSVVFDAMGRTAAGLSITLSSGDVILVEPETGYVHD
ncbi:MAG: prepilin-type N-terminal cleavage/methylation domain-containing protein [Gammaproteobacteria bacterium]|jgi:MSHA pilin protein MshC|nr:prepilin-type N-terminal cleavage/methylation domain-containing protein [Gammaproteobacteria bacterium]